MPGPPIFLFLTERSFCLFHPGKWGAYWPVRILKGFHYLFTKDVAQYFEANAKLNICRDGLKIFPGDGNLTARNGEDF